MGPIDYSIDVKSPFEGAIKGYQTVQAIKTQQADALQKQAAQARTRQMNADFLAASENPTTENIARLSIAYPERAEQMEKVNKMLDSGERDARVMIGSQVYTALRGGNPELAQQILEERATAQENSGDKRNAAATRAQIEVIKQNPQMATAGAGVFLASLMGADKFAETFKSAGEEKRKEAAAPGELAKTEAETVSTLAGAQEKLAGVRAKDAETGLAPLKAADIRSQIGTRAAQLKLDRDKVEGDLQFKMAELVQKSGQLPDDVRKDANEAMTNSVVSTQSAGQLRDLATQVDGIGSSWGQFANAREWVNGALGSETAFTGIRNEYTRLTNSIAIKAFKSSGATGSTSDKDIAMALSGIPKPTDSPEKMSSFLRGMAKLQDISAVTEEAKAEWLAKNKSLTSAGRDINVMGVQVPKGTNFADFSKTFVKQKAEEAGKKAAINNSSYSEFGAQ